MKNGNSRVNLQVQIAALVQYIFESICHNGGREMTGEWSSLHRLVARGRRESDSLDAKLRKTHMFHVDGSFRGLTAGGSVTTCHSPSIDNTCLLFYLIL